jgi:hypothetical protein
VVSNTVGSATSAGAVFAVSSAAVGPTITAQPLSVNVVTGQKVALLVNAAGTGLSYQWNGVKRGVIAGATSSLFVINSATASDADIYFCNVSNSGGTTASSGAIVAVASTANTLGYLRALSLRGNVGAGADAFFVGFVGGGNVLVKAVGPNLATTFGLTGVLADPQLEIQNFATSARLFYNDNWGSGGAGNTASLLADNNTAGAFPLTDSTSKDSALSVFLASGTYTAKASGVNDTTGVALVEFYALSTAANLRALSLRGNAGAGADAFFVGFVIAGDTAKTVLIKAVGPGLATLFGLPGAMVDPQITLTNYPQGAVLGTNDNWGGTADLTTANNAAGAFPLNDPNSKDSAMLITLPPGTYIANVSGVNNTTGVVLVEIYGL